MSELPFMQLYVSDYLGDTRHLSCEQHGAYMLLLMTMWNAHGSLPDDDTKLARMVCLSVKKWRGIKADVMEFFAVSDGVVTHPRLSRELQKSERQSESRASAGAKGGAAKALNYNKPRLANGIAGTQHLPEPYRKERATLLVPTESAVSVDRWSQEDLFHACEQVTGKPVPSYMQRQVYPVEVIEQAKAMIAAAMSEAATEVSH